MGKVSGSTPAPTAGVFVSQPPAAPTAPSTPKAAPAPKAPDAFEAKKLPQKSIEMKEGPYGPNKVSTSLKSSKGPIPAKAWDNPAELVGHLTQTPAASSGGNSSYRCGPSSLLGSTLMAGPDHAAKFLTNVANHPDNKLLTSAQKQELRDIAQRIKDKKATYEDLGRAQDLLYRAGNNETSVDAAVAEALTTRGGVKNLNPTEKRELTALQNKETWNAQDVARISELLTKASGSPSKVVPDPMKAGTWMLQVAGNRSNSDNSGFTDRELSNLARMGGIQQKQVAISGEQGVAEIFAGLKPGESAVLRVSGDGNTKQADHFITLGRRENGTAYIYNSDPAKGDPTLFVGAKGDKQPDAFNAQLEKYEDRLWADQNGEFPQYSVVSPG